MNGLSTSRSDASSFIRKLPAKAVIKKDLPNSLEPMMKLILHILNQASFCHFCIGEPSYFSHNIALFNCGV